MYLLLKNLKAGWLWHTPLIYPRRQRQGDLCEFKATLVYIVNFYRVYNGRSCLKNKRP